ncbi:MAG: S-layer homology domain-containing protein [Natronincolaceae bacterium]|jgi:hypothetical protein|nr:S-layer homology domain-containing protein [Bacillota bacterium]
MNVRRTLSVVLCFLSVCSFSLGFFAYAHGSQGDDPFVPLGNITQEEPAPLYPDDNFLTEEQAGEYLRQIGLYRGYDDGTLGLDRNITRAEFATLAVRLEGLEDLQGRYRGETIFKDMPANHWASGYVNIAVSGNLIKGFEDKTFRPEEKITYVQALAVVIRILGYEKDVIGEWPDNYIDKGVELGLVTRGDGPFVSLGNMTQKEPAPLCPVNAPINRGEIAILIYNALKVPVAGQP